MIFHIAIDLCVSISNLYPVITTFCLRPFLEYFCARLESILLNKEKKRKIKYRLNVCFEFIWLINNKTINSDLFVFFRIVHVDRSFFRPIILWVGMFVGTIQVAWLIFQVEVQTSATELIEAHYHAFRKTVDMLRWYHVAREVMTIYWVSQRRALPQSFAQLCRAYKYQNTKTILHLHKMS